MHLLWHTTLTSTCGWIAPCSIIQTNTFLVTQNVTFKAFVQDFPPSQNWCCVHDISIGDTRHGTAVHSCKVALIIVNILWQFTYLSNMSWYYIHQRFLPFCCLVVKPAWQPMHSDRGAVTNYTINNVTNKE